MNGVNFLAVGVTAVAAIALSSVWYILFGNERMRLLGDDPRSTADVRRVHPLKMLGEFVRNSDVAFALGHLVAILGISSWTGAVELGVWLWIGFPLMILTGSVTWDRRPWRLAAIHAGDWLLKSVLMAVILSSWH